MQYCKSGSSLGGGSMEAQPRNRRRRRAESGHHGSEGLRDRLIHRMRIRPRTAHPADRPQRLDSSSDARAHFRARTLIHSRSFGA